MCKKYMRNLLARQDDGCWRHISTGSCSIPATREALGEMPVQERLDGLGVVRIQTGAAVIRPLRHKEIRPSAGEAVPEPQGMLEGKALILLSMDDQHWRIYLGGQPYRAHRVHATSVKDIHPEDDHRPEKGTKDPVVGTIEAPEGLLGLCIAAFQEEQPHPPRVPGGRDEGRCCADGVPVEQHRLVHPVEHRLDILGKTRGIHETPGAGTSMIAGAVDDGRKSHLTKDPCPSHHPAPIPAPPVGHDDNAPGRTIRLYAPYLQEPALPGRDLRVRDLSPVGRVVDRSARHLMDEVRKQETQKKVEKTGSKDDRQHHIHIPPRPSENRPIRTDVPSIKTAST